MVSVFLSNIETRMEYNDREEERKQRIEQPIIATDDNKTK